MEGGCGEGQIDGLAVDLFVAGGEDHGDFAPGEAAIGDAGAAELQPTEVVFWDDFESGTTVRWSLVVP